MTGMLADQAARPQAVSAQPARVRTPVAAADAVWLQDTPQNPMIINALYVCDRLAVEALREVFRTNVLEVDGGRRFDRFLKRVVTIDGRYFWETVADFDIRRHIFPSPAEGIRTKEDLQSLLGEMAAQPLPGDRPLWQLQVIDFGDDSAVIIRIHHCMGDGMALLPVVFALVGCVPQVAATHKPRYARAAIKAVAAAAAPYVLVEKALRMKDANVLRGQVMSGTKRVAWSAPLPVARIKEVKSCLGATVNDVLMSCVAGAIHRYDQLEAAGRLIARRGMIVLISDLLLEPEPVLGIAGLEVVERDAVLGVLGLLLVDALDLQQRQVVLGAHHRGDAAPAREVLRCGIGLAAADLGQRRVATARISPLRG